SVALRLAGQPIEVLGHLRQRAGRFDNLPNGGLQLVEELVEQLDHGADFIVRHDVDTLGQIAVAAGNGAQGIDHPVYVAHDVARDPPSAAPHENDQQDAEADAQLGGRNVAATGKRQGLLKILIGTGAKGGGHGLGPLEIAGHALQVFSQVAKRSCTVDQLARNLEGVFAIGIYGVAQGLQFLTALGVFQQAAKLSLLSIDVIEQQTGVV